MIKSGWLLLSAAASLLHVCMAQRTLSNCPPLPDSRVAQDCVWQTSAAAAATNLTISAARTGRFPAITLDGRAAVPANYSASSLTLERVLVRNMTLSPAVADGANAAVPRLLPLGLLTEAPARLTLIDVRMVVRQQDFDAYLALFRRELSTPVQQKSAGALIHTDNSSFINIPYLSDNRTEVFALTLIGGPCAPLGNSSTQPLQQAVTGLTTAPGCNVRTADNQTLVATLQNDGGIRTDTPLLIRLLSNATLGPGLSTAIDIRRPVVMLGRTSVVTSIDFGMTTNILNVTTPGARLSWQGLVLENLAPGDSTSSIVAAPFSTTVSTNLWAVYCNRSAAHQGRCLTLTNVTLVLLQQDEINYQTFMYTMYTSPSASLRELAAFYDTDLKTEVLQFVPGPGNDTLTSIRFLNLAWDFWYVTSTLRPAVAPKMPPPRQAFSLRIDRPGPLVQAVRDCAELQAAAAVPLGSNRSRIYMMLTNISVAEAGTLQCNWPGAVITGPTELHGEVAGSSHDHAHDFSSQQVQVLQQTAAATAATAAAVQFPGPGASVGESGGLPGQQAADSGGDDLPAQRGRDNDTATATAAAAPLLWPEGLCALRFGFLPGLFQLPADVKDKGFFKLDNVTLSQLPQQLQAPAAGHSNSSNGSNDSSGRRLLQKQQQHRSGLPATPPGAWTILLWSISRPMSAGAPLLVSDAQVRLPHPEWGTLAREAAQGPSFVVQLSGFEQGLAFTGVTRLPGDSNALRVAALQAPGMEGTNLVLLPQSNTSAAARARLGGYSWPPELLAGAAASSDSSSGRNAVGLAVGVPLGVLGLLLLLLAAAVAVHLRRRRKRSAGMQLPAIKEGWEVGDKREYAGGDLSAAGGSGRDQLPESDASAAVAAAGDDSSSKQRLPVALAASNGQAGQRDTATAQAESGDADAPVTNKQQQQASEGGSSSNVSTVQNTIAQKLERWNNAVSSTTLQLMQQRLQRSNLRYAQSAAAASAAASAVGSSSRPAKSVSASSASSRSSSSRRQLQQQEHQLLLSTCTQGAAALLSPQPPPAAAQAGVPGVPAAGTPGAGGQDLLLHEAIGAGSFGSVYLGSWRGKRVAVKVMDLNRSMLLASGALQPQQESGGGGQEQQQGGSQQQLQQQQQRRQQQRQANSVPHMAVMEAVVSSAMSHPNVVQVYTYYLTPLLLQQSKLRLGPSSSPHTGAPGDSGAAAAAAAAAAAEADDGDGSNVFGWSLRLVMEWMEQGSLRDALDRRRLPCLPDTRMPHLAVVHSLSHDVAAALLHLHTEGIVHGDLKAGNVLLTVNTALQHGCGGRQCNSSSEVFVAAGSPPLTAKVGDFGLALPLGPQDTHATMMARGTASHMSPEVVLHGHISKASDVYAFGILLFELVTRRRAFAGTPTPLLAHAVAVGGLRPAWPAGVAPELQPLCRLAEACWAQEPTNRPTFEQVLAALEGRCNGEGSGDCSSHHQASSNHQQHQQQQQLSHRVRHCLLQAPAAARMRTTAVAAAAASPPVTPETSAGPPQGRAAAGGCKPGLSWSEVSYGGGKHKGFF